VETEMGLLGMVNSNRTHGCFGEKAGTGEFPGQCGEVKKGTASSEDLEDPREIPRLLEELDDTIRCLAEELAVLAKRLRPISNSRSMAEREDPEKQPSPQTVLGEKIQESINALKLLIETIGHLITDMEV